MHNKGWYEFIYYTWGISKGKVGFHWPYHIYNHLYFYNKILHKSLSRAQYLFRMRIVKIFNVGFQGGWATSKSKINKMKMKSNQN